MLAAIAECWEEHLKKGLWHGEKLVQALCSQLAVCCGFAYTKQSISVTFIYLKATGPVDACQQSVFKSVLILPPGLITSPASTHTLTHACMHACTHTCVHSHMDG